MYSYTPTPSYFVSAVLCTKCYFQSLYYFFYMIYLRNDPGDTIEMCKNAFIAVFHGSLAIKYKIIVDNVMS